MFATATVVEIDNRLTGRRSKILIAQPRARLLADLRAALAIDPAPAAPEPAKAPALIPVKAHVRVTAANRLSFNKPRDASHRDPVDACVFVDRWGAIRVVIYPAETTGTAATVDGLDSETTATAEKVDKAKVTWFEMEEPPKAWASLQVGLTRAEADEERHLVDVLAENLRRLMDRKGITPDILAQLAGIDPDRLAEILDKKTPAVFLDEVCNLAEGLGTTADGLFLFRPKDHGAEGWN